MYKYKRGIPVDYDTQGYIYFASRLYGCLTGEEQQRLNGLCRRAGGEHYAALFDFVVCGLGYVACCDKHYISQAQLYRLVRRYYILFADEISRGLW